MNQAAQMRSEIKYLVPNSLLEDLREAIAPMVKLDKYGKDYQNVGYTVRSSYLDTPSLLFYHEKLDGLKKRKKLRIRAYNQPLPGGKVFLEIKRKVESKISKDRAPLAFENLGLILQPQSSLQLSEIIEGNKQALTSANKFLFHLHRKNLQCTNLVVYEREAFEGEFNPTLRITFDKNLRSKISSDPADLYSDDDLVNILPGHFILEIKYNYSFPSWLTPLIAQFKLKKQALSKYVMSLEQCTGLKGQHLLLSLQSRYRRNTPVPVEKHPSIKRRNKGSYL